MNSFSKPISQLLPVFTVPKLLALVILLGVMLRFTALGSWPPILNRDEAALAYNSWLLLETGQDEWQQAWPLAFKSFGDYKLPGYHWLAVASFSVFGLSDFAVRLPSALFGVLLIYMVFKFVENLTSSSRLGLWTAFLVATGPVFIFYSRMAYEANVGLTLLVASLTILLDKKPLTKWQVLLAAGLWSMAILTYNTPLLLLPLILPLIMLRQRVDQVKNWIVPVALLVIIFCAGWLSLSNLSAQKGNITIFQDEATTIHYGDFRAQFEPFLQPILGHRLVYLSRFVLQNTLSSFSYKFLVERGGQHPWHALPNWAHMYWQVYVFGLLGLGSAAWGLWKKLQLKNRTLVNWLTSFELTVLLLLFIGLAPSVVTVDSPHATRSLLFFVCWYVLAALGIQQSINLGTKFFQNKSFKLIATTLIVVVLTYEAAKYGYSSIFNYPQIQSEALRTGFEAVVSEIPLGDESEQIAVVDPDGYQYIMLAWYGRIPADVFFATIHRQLPNQIGFEYVDYLSNVHFISQPGDREDEAYLVQWIGHNWLVTK